MNKIAIFLAALSVSWNAFASGQNLIVCENADNDESLAIRQDVGGQYVGLYSAELNWSGGQTTVAYKIEREGRFEFDGKDMTFQFSFGSNPHKGTGIISIKSLGIANEKIDCELLWD